MILKEMKMNTNMNVGAETLADFADQLDVIVALDLSQTPIALTLKRFRDKLSGKLPSRIVSKLLGKIVVDVDDSFINNEEMSERIIESYAKIAIKIHDLCMDEFDSEEMFLGMMEKFQLLVKGM